ncbi:type II secretion system protein [Actinotalea solisilvae]|uniref:type II secretion system protein n=1 Tax=Actinotalea solisilvae TaxID=2072922 RepID=UPI001F158656|nr:prepilin-type N-terminal cleavage/methylation domain-containing protein [Actinotalea solisilvae]
MMSRIRKSIEEKDQGFTLIELLVVMIIIGILAAIAIPVFMNQRKKAVDSSATSDVSTLGKEVATYYVDASTVLAAPGGVSVSGTDLQVNSVSVGNKSKDTVSAALSYPGAAGSATTTAASQSWCVTLTYTGGTRSTAFYSAENGLSTTSC